MRKSWRLLLLLVGVLALAVILPACSDDDPTDPGGGGGPDTEAPTVAGVSPSNGSTQVSDSEPVVITFNEAMDPDSDDGEITLSSGTITGQTWTDSRNLTVTHTDWPEATRIEVTVGTGLADEAGNNLASALTFGFWTESATLAFLDSDPADGATDVNRNASVVVRFSTDMNEASLLSGITIADDTKANYEFTVDSGDQGQYTLDPVETLPASTLITVTITTAVQTDGGENLAEQVSFDFTTGMDIDTTPPTIVGFDPPSGSTLPPDQGSVSITFSEAMDTGSLQPSRMNGQFYWLLSQVESEPLWNAEGTEITVPLPDDLPAGLRLEIGFAGYADANGVVQPDETLWTADVAGTGTPYPVSDGARYAMFGSWERGELGNETPTDGGDEATWYQFTARGGSQWNVEEYFDPSYGVVDYYDIFSVTSSSVSWLGFGEDMTTPKELTELFFTTPVVMADLPLSVGATWTTTTQLTFPGEGTVDATLDGEVISRADLPFEADPGFDVYWSDAWQVDLVLEASIGGDDLILEERSYWFVEGVGMVRQLLYEESYDPEDDPGWERTELWLIPEFD